MSGVLRVTQIPPSATDEDVKNIFQSNNIYPLDVHWVLDYGKKTGTAFIVFQNKDLKKGMKLHGVRFRGNRISVHPSSHNEFNDYFPSIPMVRNSNGRSNTTQPRNFAYTTMDNSRDSTYYNPNETYGYGNTYHLSKYGGDSHGSYHDKHDKNNDDSIYNAKYSRVGYTTRSSFNKRQDDMHLEYKKSSAYEFCFENQSPHKTTTKEPRKRSRSPVDRRIVEDVKSDSKRKSLPQEKKPVKGEKKASAINEKKYIRIFGMSFTCSANDFTKFLEPLEVKEIYLLKFKRGANAGKPNGSAIIEMANEKHATEALSKFDGKDFDSRPIQVVRAAKDDIVAALEDLKKGGVFNADLSTLNSLANSNPQIQRLLGLLNDAVADATKNKPSTSSQTKSSSRDDKERPRSSTSDKASSHHKDSDSSSTNSKSAYRQSGRSSLRSKIDTTISRVASSANINEDDIKARKVVGMRNLPSHVDVDMILAFFHGYDKITDSVRIHYLEMGRCSGDAIIAFHTTEEARRAVKNLNKKSVDNRKIELFFL